VEELWSAIQEVAVMTKVAFEVEIKDWNYFVSLTNKFDVGFPFRSVYVFRGQARDAWSLIPSLTRNAKSTGINSEQTLKLENEARKEFYEQAHLYLPHRATPESREELLGWWSLMQHYNVPTRILDWTESPFVAAYFAVEQHPDDAGVVWVVHIPKVKKHIQEMSLSYEIPIGIKEQEKVLLDPHAKPNLYFITPRIHTDRMGPQQTVSTFSDQILADHGQVIASAGADKETFIKLIIPNTLKLEFLHKLRQMNITARTLFPGVDGLGRSVAELVKLGAYYYRSREGKGHQGRTAGGFDPLSKP